jgi:hypothetical protein
VNGRCYYEDSGSRNLFWVRRRSMRVSDRRDSPSTRARQASEESVERDEISSPSALRGRKGRDGRHYRPGFLRAGVVLSTNSSTSKAFAAAMSVTRA